MHFIKNVFTMFNEKIYIEVNVATYLFKILNEVFKG